MKSGKDQLVAATKSVGEACGTHLLRVSWKFSLLHVIIYKQ
jgi:hypothetical protein